MSRKGFLLLFLSQYRKENKEIKEEKYFVNDSDGQEIYFWGTQTNDAPVKYLIDQAAKNDVIIQKIACIVTDKVRNEGDYDQFQCMVNQYIQDDEHLKRFYQNQQIKYCEINYGDEIKEAENRAAYIYQQIISDKCFGNASDEYVYIDYTGGLRDISFLMTLIIRYLEYRRISCKKIVYSQKNTDSPNRIYSMDYIYDMFQLLNGVDQFVRTGNAELLQDCYQQEDDEATKDLLSQIVKFSKVMNLCDINDVDEIIPEISESLKRYDERKEKKSFFVEMFGDLTAIIREKLYIKENNTLTYPQLIQWCVDNNMIQQALTLYIEKMPAFYYESGMLVLPEKGKAAKNKNSLKTEEADSFYKDLFNRLAEVKADPHIKNLSKKFHELSQKLKENTQNPVFRLDGLYQIKKELTDKEEKQAIDRIKVYLRKNYINGEGKLYNEQMILPYEDTVNKPGTAYKFVNELIKHDKKWLHYFLYNNRNDYEQNENIMMGQYEKKVVALDCVKEANTEIPESNVSKEQLYNMMKYYLALKIVRNCINHASELSEEKELDDMKKAVRRMKEQHGICIMENERFQFENIKQVLSAGVSPYINR